MPDSKLTCFVVQGFGRKTDYTTGKEFDLNASYEVIKMAVEAAGLECVRADEIVHSGTIDVPMYEWLLNADLVIADLSTYNINAAFELGVRYALKPYTTIVLAEEGFKNPFDLSHVVIRHYKHLGEEIGFKEANRLMSELKGAITTIVNANKTDSPVYTYLPELQPPCIGKKPRQETDLNELLLKEFKPQDTPKVLPASAPPPPHPNPTPVGRSTPPEVTAIVGEDNPSAKIMLDMAMAKMNDSKFEDACTLLKEVHTVRPNDTFVVQQMALATYKSKCLPPIEALHKAKEILQTLSPETTNNPETLGLWGSVHKKIWEINHDPKDLNEAIAAHERGFYMKQDNYNGINLAFLLNVRALEKLKNGEKDEAIADTIVAKRVRQDVIRYASALFDDMKAEEQTNPSGAQNRDDFTSKRFWLVATLHEAAVGADDDPVVAKWEQEAQAMPVPDWMQDTRHNQGEKLQALLTEYKMLAEKAT